MPIRRRIVHRPVPPVVYDPKAEVRSFIAALVPQLDALIRCNAYAIANDGVGLLT